MFYTVVCLNKFTGKCPIRTKEAVYMAEPNINNERNNYEKVDIREVRHAYWYVRLVYK